MPDVDRLSTIRFPLALSLVFLHADRGGEFSTRMAGSPFLAEGVRLLSMGLGSFRLPAFFLIAGYLYFRAAPSTGPAWYRRKIGSRARSLLLPLVSWNLLALIVLGSAQQIPSLRAFFNASSEWSAPVVGFTASQWLTALFGSADHQPLVFPLWFLRDLFLLVLLTPAIHAAIRASGGAVTLLVALLWLAGLRNPLVSPDALFFFFVGCHVAIARRSLFSLDAFGPFAAVVWLGLQLVGVHDAAAPAFGRQLQGVCGVVAVLWTSGILARRAGFVRHGRRLEPFAFFLFLAHEPLLTVTRKVSLKLLHLESPIALLGGYLGVIALVTVLLFGVFELAGRKAPGLLAALTGGRSGRLPPVPSKPASRAPTPSAFGAEAASRH